MKNVIVTGASRGIGLDIAKVLASGGYRAIAIARSETDAMQAAIAQARSGGVGDICFTPFDLLNSHEIPNLARYIRTTHGSIYGLVNNAGIGTVGLLASMSIEDIERLVALNTVAPIVLTKHVIRSMMAAGEGRVVNMSSIVATTGYAGLSVYSATKASLLGFTRSLAREVGPLGITVNAIAPGFIATEMTNGADAAQLAAVARRSSLKRLADVQDIAHMVEFLLSDKARNVTGTVVTVDAGATA